MHVAAEHFWVQKRDLKGERRMITLVLLLCHDGQWKDRQETGGWHVAQVMG